MKLTELFLNRFLYKDTTQNLETKDSAFVSADSTPSEPSSIPSGGAAQDINTGSVTINGQQLTPGTFPQTTLDVSNWGWGQTCVFSSTDLDTVSWGAGTFTSADGTSYAISAGNTGNMTAKTYIYLSLLTSTTAYQITTTPSDAVGVGKVLIAVAQNDTVTSLKATYNLSEATQIVGDNILANSINASKIVTGQLIVGTNVNLGTAFPTTSAGSLAYLNLAGAAQLDSTVIVGGLIKTSLLSANNIITGTLNASLVTVSNLIVGTNVGLGTAKDAAGVTTIIGDTVTTSYLNAKNITAAGIVTGALIQSESGLYSGAKMSSALNGIVVYGQNFEVRDTANTLYGSIGGYGGYFNISAVGGRNMLLGAPNATVFFANDIGSALPVGGLIGSPSVPFNTIYGGNFVGNNYYSDGNVSYMRYFSSAWNFQHKVVAPEVSSTYLTSVNTLRLAPTSSPLSDNGSIHFDGTHFYGRIAGVLKQLDN